MPLCNLAFDNYCAVASAPSSLYSTAPSSLNTQVNSTSIYSCNNGFNGSQTITCNALNATAGTWSALTGSCEGMALKFLSKHWLQDLHCTRMSRIWHKPYSYTLLFSSVQSRICLDARLRLRSEYRYSL